MPSSLITLVPASSNRTYTAKRSNSIAHIDFLSERVVIFHIDIEHSGKEAGIVLQLLVVEYEKFAASSTVTFPASQECQVGKRSNGSARKLLTQTYNVFTISFINIALMCPSES
jgi:hypothetical protein